MQRTLDQHANHALARELEVALLKLALLRSNLETVLTKVYETVNAVLITCTVTKDSTLAIK